MPRGSNQFPRDLPDLLGQLDLEVLEQWNQLLEDLPDPEQWNLLLLDLPDLELSKLDLLDLPAPVPLVHLAVLWDPGHPEGLLDLGQLSLLLQHPLALEYHLVPVGL